MENKMIFIAEEEGFIIEADGKKLRVSYDEFSGDHEDAMKFWEEQGGGDETVVNLRFIARHRDAINEELKKLGKEIITGWYWTNEIAWWSADWAFVVDTSDGHVCDGNRNYDGSFARAISAL